jgi:hypothetical protein
VVEPSTDLFRPIATIPAHALSKGRAFAVELLIYQASQVLSAN